MPKFSVIVPVYNGERYLERCLDSIVASIGKAREWEIVCVDDASTDRTAEILARFNEKTAIPCRLARHEVNRGLGESRNTGLEHAKGEWIAWVDADDEVTAAWADSISRQTAGEAQADPAPDVLCFGAWMEKVGKRRQMVPRRAPWTGAAGDFLKDIVLDLGSSTWMWNKVFRKTLFKGLRFSGRCLEDFRLMPAILARAKVARTLAEPLYVYHRPAGSLTRKGDCSGYREGLEAAAALTWRETAGLGADFPRVWREGMCLRIADFLRNIGESAEMRRYLRRQLGLVLMDGRQSLRVKVKCLLAALGI